AAHAGPGQQVRQDRRHGPALRRPVGERLERQRGREALGDRADERVDVRAVRSRALSDDPGDGGCRRTGRECRLMAVAPGTLNRRQREEAKAGAKAKRDKIILGVGGAVLLAVLVIEVPGLMKGSSSPPPPPPPAAASATPATPATPGALTPNQVRAA